MCYPKLPTSHEIIHFKKTRVIIEQRAGDFGRWILWPESKAEAQCLERAGQTHHRPTPSLVPPHRSSQGNALRLSTR